MQTAVDWNRLTNTTVHAVSVNSFRRTLIAAAKPLCGSPTTVELMPDTWMLQRTQQIHIYRRGGNAGGSRVQELRESRGGRPGLSFRPDEPYGFCGRKATLNRASALVTVCP